MDKKKIEEYGPKKAIKIWMIENDIRAVDVAKSMGLTRSSISRWLDCSCKFGRIDKHMRGLGLPEEFIEARHKNLRPVPRRTKYRTISPGSRDGKSKQPVSAAV